MYAKYLLRLGILLYVIYDGIIYEPIIIIITNNILIIIIANHRSYPHSCNTSRDYNLSNTTSHVAIRVSPREWQRKMVGYKQLRVIHWQLCIKRRGKVIVRMTTQRSFCCHSQGETRMYKRCLSIWDTTVEKVLSVRNN